MSNKVWKRFNRANVPSCHLLFHAATQARSDTATFALGHLKGIRYHGIIWVFNDF